MNSHLTVKMKRDIFRIQLKSFFKYDLLGTSNLSHNIIGKNANVTAGLTNIEEVEMGA